MHPILNPLKCSGQVFRNTANLLPQLSYYSNSSKNNNDNSKDCDPKKRTKIDNNENHAKDKVLEKLLEDVPTNCCMSGCANCVWVEYAEKLLEHLSEEGGMIAVRQIEKHVNDANMKAFLMHEFRMRKIIK